MPGSGVGGGNSGSGNVGANGVSSGGTSTTVSSVAAHFGNSFAGGAGSSTASKLAAVVAAQHNSSSATPNSSSAFDRYVSHSLISRLVQHLVREEPFSAQAAQISSMKPEYHLACGVFGFVFPLMCVFIISSW